MLNELDHDELLVALRLINDAQEQGSTWADIATAFGYPDAKAAKNDVKDMARRLERRLRAEAERGVPDGDA